jgi:uncharacterized protein (TIGR00159 family)
MWLRDLWDTFQTIRATDVLDIAVISGLLYFVLLWFKQTKAAFVARGIFIFVIVYVIAQQAGMYLTTWMFQGFFAIFLIALVVIFQEELRSFFERLAVWSLRRAGARAPAPREAEVLVRTVGQLARGRIGALIVLRGRDPLERHIEGGHDLDGRLSGPLLLSLFDPHSEGHDGAVVIEGDRVVRFGGVLPLSKAFDRLSGVGTRHAAALGLAERTDALCLVVSEERGSISVARDDMIVPVKSLEELEGRLTTFLREKAPLKAKARWRDVVRHNVAEKLIAVAISLGLWLVFVKGYSPASEAFRVPVDARAVPAHLSLVSVQPSSVNVTLKGLKRDLKLLNPLSLRVVLDLSKIEPGEHTLPIAERHVRIPGALQLAQVDPAAVEVTLIAQSEEATAQAKEKTAPLLRFLGLNDDAAK